MSTTALSLEDRVAALEEIVANLSDPTTLEPNVITVSPTGQIGAVFSGKVQASELDLFGGATQSPIVWITPGGAVLATLTVDASGNLILNPSGALFSNGLHLNEVLGPASGAPSEVIYWDAAPAHALGGWLQGYFDAGGEHHLAAGAGAGHLDLLHVNTGGVKLSDWAIGAAFKGYLTLSTGTLTNTHVAIPGSSQLVTVGNTGLIIMLASVFINAANTQGFVSWTIDGTEVGPTFQIEDISANVEGANICAAYTYVAGSPGATHIVGMNAWATASAGAAGPASGVIITP